MMSHRLNDGRYRFAAHHALEERAQPAPRLRRLSTLSAAAALVGLCLLTLCQAQSPAALPADREERWRQDLIFFADEFASHHADFAKLYPQPRFNHELYAWHTKMRIKPQRTQSTQRKKPLTTLCAL